MAEPRGTFSPSLSNTSNQPATSIEKLQGIDNYTTWKFAMRLILNAEGLWQCVVSTDADRDADPTRDSRALARICLSLQPNLYQYVCNCKTAHEAWKKLSDTFEDRGLYRKV